MQDHTFDDIVTEIHRDFPVPLPKFVIKKILRHSLRSLFAKVNRQRHSVSLYDVGIARIYHPIDFDLLEKNFQDVDETKDNFKRGFSPRLLKFFHEKRSPRTVLWGYKDRTFVYHKRGAT